MLPLRVRVNTTFGSGNSNHFNASHEQAVRENRRRRLQLPPGPDATHQPRHAQETHPDRSSASSFKPFATRHSPNERTHTSARVASLLSRRCVHDRCAPRPPRALCTRHRKREKAFRVRRDVSCSDRRLVVVFPAFEPFVRVALSCEMRADLHTVTVHVGCRLKFDRRS